MLTTPVCLCMIVRDEASVIERCLRSVLPYISHWAIVDTGSQDGTREVIRTALGGLPGKLADQAWQDDFALHRNQSVSLAREVLGSTDGHLLFIDADETLVVRKPMHFARLVGTRSAITWWAVDGDWCFRKLGIVAANQVGLWHGSVHEMLQLTQPETAPRRVQRFAELTYGHDGFRRRCEVTSLLDLEQLKLGSLADVPISTDYRKSFFLARTYEFAGDFKSAAACFEIAAGVSTTSLDDRWQALWGLGRVLLHLERSRACQVLLRAHCVAPTRAEAMVELSAVARSQGQMVEAMSLAKAALNCSEPAATTMYDRSAYGWRAVDELCMSAFALRDNASMSAALIRYRSLVEDAIIPASELGRIRANMRILEGALIGDHL